MTSPTKPTPTTPTPTKPRMDDVCASSRILRSGTDRDPQPDPDPAPSPWVRTDCEIHALSVVHPEARLGRRVRIGPFSTVGPHVELGDDVVVESHAVIDGHTSLGPGVRVFPFAAVGLPPQDLKYDGSPTRLVVGARTVIRESVTLQPGSVGPGCGTTRVGEDCLIMAYCHVAHDCEIGHRVIMANGTQIAGHCRVDDHAILGGLTTVHQFVRIGTRAFTGASTRVQQDVPPFLLADGHPAGLIGLNIVGLRRAGFSKEALAALKRAYKTLFRGGRYKDALAELSERLSELEPEVRVLVEFLLESTRGVTRARVENAGGAGTVPVDGPRAENARGEDARGEKDD